MAKFKELNQTLNLILDNLISNQNLCKLLSNNSKNPLEAMDIDDTSQLLFDKIYPLPKIPKIPDEQGSFLTVWLDDFRRPPSSVSFKSNIITFNILCHYDLWRMDGELRPYAILHEIDQTFNQKRIAGVGKLQIESGNFLWQNDVYSGYQVKYKMYDWN